MTRSRIINVTKRGVAIKLREAEFYFNPQSFVIFSLIPIPVFFSSPCSIDDIGVSRCAPWILFSYIKHKWWESNVSFFFLSLLPAARRRASYHEKKNDETRLTRCAPEKNCEKITRFSLRLSVILRTNPLPTCWLSRHVQRRALSMLYLVDHYMNIFYDCADSQIN